MHSNAVSTVDLPQRDHNKRMYVCTHTEQMHALTCACMHARRHTCIHTYAHKLARTSTHTLSHTHIHPLTVSAASTAAFSCSRCSSSFSPSQTLVGTWSGEEHEMTSVFADHLFQQRSLCTEQRNRGLIPREN